MKKKEMKRENDSLLQSFQDFVLPSKKLGQFFGGESTDGRSSDPDGCTAEWTDQPGGGYCHTEDQWTKDKIE